MTTFMTPLKQLAIFCVLIFLTACSNGEKIHYSENYYSDNDDSVIPTKSVGNITPSLEHFNAQDEAIFGSAFLYAVSANNYVEAKQHINIGADVNAPDPVNKTPIEIAINNDSADMLRLLLEHGAQPNYFAEPISCNAILATASGGDTRFYIMPLDMAYKKGNAEIISLLEQADAKSASKCFEAENAERKLLELLQPVY